MGDLLNWLPVICLVVLVFNIVKLVRGPIPTGSYETEGCAYIIKRFIWIIISATGLVISTAYVLLT